MKNDKSKTIWGFTIYTLSPFRYLTTEVFDTVAEAREFKNEWLKSKGEPITITGIYKINAPIPSREDNGKNQNKGVR